MLAASRPDKDATVRDGVVRAPVLLMVVEAEPPNAAVVPVTREEKEELVVVAFVPVALAKTNGPVSVVEAEVSPPLKAKSVVVALEGNGYAKVVAEVR